MSANTDIFADDTDADFELDTDVQPTDATDAAPATDAPSADDKAAAQAAADAEHGPTVTAFTELVDATLEASAESEDGVSDDELDAIRTAYRAITGGIKFKNQGKNYVQDRMSAELDAENFAYAVALNSIKSHLATKEEKAPSAPRPKADPREAFATRYAALSLAAELFGETAAGDEALDGWADKLPSADELDDVRDEVRSLLAWDADESEDKGDAPEATPLAVTAYKAVLGRGLGGKPKSGSTSGTGTGYSGPRRDVRKHITEVFANEPSGTFLTIGEIVGRGSSEYEAGTASQGAVSAQVFHKSGKSNVDGIGQGHHPETGVKGAVKL